MASVVSPNGRLAGELLTSAELDRYDPEHLEQRIASGKAITAVVPFQSAGPPSAGRSPSHGPRRRARRGGSQY